MSPALLAKKCSDRGRLPLSFFPLLCYSFKYIKGGIPMNVRMKVLWKVPVFCIVASWISFYLTVYLGGFFFTVKTAGADGTIYISADPIRSVIWDAGLFCIVLFAGGLWTFRSMTKAEIAVSASVTSFIYFMAVSAQLLIPDFPLEASVVLAYFQNWTGMLSSFLMKMRISLPLSVILSSFAPLLFIPFGRKSGA